jgi:hypothetical protein
MVALDLATAHQHAHRAYLVTFFSGSLGAGFYLSAALS